MARISDPHENERGSAQRPSNGKTIILAEDDPFIARMYQIKLTSGGFRVIMANNGRDAYTQIMATKPDLAMFDINMPELSGFEVVKALRADKASLPASHIIMLTNSANPTDRKQATDLGIDYLIKAEMTPREVLNHINSKLGLPLV
jgi:DNA-binding response OmpR family regulator